MDKSDPSKQTLEEKRSKKALKFAGTLTLGVVGLHTLHHGLFGLGQNRFAKAARTIGGTTAMLTVGYLSNRRKPKPEPSKEV